MVVKWVTFENYYRFWRVPNRRWIWVRWTKISEMFIFIFLFTITENINKLSEAQKQKCWLIYYGEQAKIIIIYFIKYYFILFWVKLCFVFSIRTQNLRFWLVHSVYQWEHDKVKTIALNEEPVKTLDLTALENLEKQFKSNEVSNQTSPAWTVQVKFRPLDQSGPLVGPPVGLSADSSLKMIFRKYPWNLIQRKYTWPMPKSSIFWKMYLTVYLQRQMKLAIRSKIFFSWNRQKLVEQPSCQFCSVMEWEIILTF